MSNDIFRIFLIIVCMYISFRLGVEYAGRKAYKALMDGLTVALKEFNNKMKQVADDTPAPNEMISDHNSQI